MIMIMVVLPSFLRAAPVEADPKKDYPVTQENGPWMIMVTSFYAKVPTPEVRAETYEQAKQLALEIRRTHKIPAYTFIQRSDFGKDLPSTRHRRPKTTGLRIDPAQLESGQIELPEDMATTELVKTKVREFDQVAVLAGNYATIDQANRVIEKKFRNWFPDSMRKILDQRPSKAKGPFWRAFATPNPYVPKEYLQEQEPDRLLVQMNSGPYSLYDCPGRYSVLVATFSGRSYVDYHKNKINQFVNELETKDQDRLERAAVEAFELAKALRQHSWEAYVFHDYNSSMVTIGNFNDANDPWLTKTIATFSVSPPKDPSALVDGSKHRPKRLGRWYFNPIARPVDVPRRDG